MWSLSDASYPLTFGNSSCMNPPIPLAKFSATFRPFIPTVSILCA